MLLDIGEKLGQAGDHFFERREHQPGAQTAGDLGHARRSLAGRRLIDGFERSLQVVGRKADRMRKFVVEQQKLGHALRTQIGGVDLAVSFKRGAAPQQADPFHVLARVHRLSGGKFVEVDVEQARDGRGALDEPAHLDELPAFAVVHGGIGDALHQVRAFENDGQKIQRLGLPKAGRFHAPHFVKKAVELFPHLRADLLANLACVLARRRDAAGDVAQRVGLRAGERIAVLGDRAGMAQAREHAQPAAV